MTATHNKRISDSSNRLDNSRLRQSISRIKWSAVIVPVIVPVIALVAIVFASWYSSYDSNRNKDIADIVNLAGRQRMLSQRVGRLAEVARIQVKSSETTIHDELENAKLQFEAEFILLTKRVSDSEFLSSPELSAAISSVGLIQSDIFSCLDEISATRDGGSSLRSDAYRELHSKIDQFLPAMESAVASMATTNNDFVASSRRRHISGFALAMLTSIAILFLFTIPAIRTLNSSLDEQYRLSSEQEKLAMVASRTSNAIIVTDCDGRIQWTNPGFTRVTEFSLDEVVGKKPGEFLQYEKSDPAVIAEIRRAVQECEPIRCQLQNRSKSGREYWLDIDIQPMIDTDGQHVGFMAIELDITENKLAEEAILAERRFLTVTLDAFTSHVAVLNSQGTIVCVNKMWREFAVANDCGEGNFGIGANYLKILDCTEGACSAEACSTAEGIRSVIRGDCDLFEFEYPLHSPDEQRWFRILVTPCEKNGATHVVIAHENITTRVIAEQRLRSKEARLKSIFDSSTDAITLIDSEGFFDCNRRAFEMFGVESEERFWGRHPSEFSPDKQPCGGFSFDLANQRLQEATEGEQVCFEWLHRRANGTTFPAEVCLTAYELEGRPVVQASIRDISERKETSNYLDMYRTIVDQHAIVAETDTAGRIVSVNNAFCKISGYSREELIDQNERLLNSGLHSTEFWRDMFKVVANGDSWHGEICNRAKDGSLYWVNTTIAPLINHDGKIKGYFTLRADITELKAAQSKAESASNSKSEFLANMSHEIRTPMTAILGYAELLADEVGRCDSTLHQLEYVDTIKCNAEHLLSIINDILDISKIEAEKIEVESIETDPQQIVEETLALMRVKAAAKGLMLKPDFPTPIPRSIQSDPTRLRQILVNLIGNAIKFTEHGIVSLITSFVPGPDPVIRFVVRDSGIGMSEEQMSRLFTAFGQADSSTTRRFGGTGLGLVISKRLSQMLDGDLTVESDYGSGSDFILSLKVKSFGPLHQVGIEEARTKNAPIESNTHPGTSLPLDNMRILFAEDGPDNQRLISFHLRKAGAIVAIAQNGKDAVQMLTSDGSVDGPLLSPVPFDLVLSDMQMPEMDGYCATRLLRSKGFSLPILALTAHAMADDAKQCIKAGCDEHITKPIDRFILVDACAKWGRGAQHDWNETELALAGENVQS